MTNKFKIEITVAATKDLEMVVASELSTQDNNDIFFENLNREKYDIRDGNDRKNSEQSI